MHAAPPIDTTSLFEPLLAQLIALLRGLAPADWLRPTAAGAWRVRDVAAHLLDGDLRKLSAFRDGHLPRPDADVADPRSLVAYLNRLNADWVRAAERLSTRVLVELLEESGPRVTALMLSLPPRGESIFPVAWAGETRSENWLDVGREYTERWHHQAQIRDAVGAPALDERRWLRPVLDVSMRALPPAYASHAAPEGTAVVLEVEGDAGGVWSVVSSGGGGWRLHVGRPPDPAAVVRLDAGSTWRMLFNALSPSAAAARARVEGDDALAAPLFRARAVMV